MAALICRSTMTSCTSAGWRGRRDTQCSRPPKSGSGASNASGAPWMSTVSLSI
ncbi:hypothetical protein ACU4GD_04230 [Cupriavidus basilensis]